MRKKPLISRRFKFGSSSRKKSSHSRVEKEGKRGSSVAAILISNLLSVSRESGDDPEVAQEEVRHPEGPCQQTRGPAPEVRLKPCDKPAESFSYLRACNAAIEQWNEMTRMDEASTCRTARTCCTSNWGWMQRLHETVGGGRRRGLESSQRLE